MTGEPKFMIGVIKKGKIFVIIFSEIMYYFKEKKRGAEGWMK